MNGTRYKWFRGYLFIRKLELKGKCLIAAAVVIQKMVDRNERL